MYYITLTRCHFIINFDHTEEINFLFPTINFGNTYNHIKMRGNYNFAKAIYPEILQCKLIKSNNSKNGLPKLIQKNVQNWLIVIIEADSIFFEK